jgi:hypothetical protein
MAITDLEGEQNNRSLGWEQILAFTQNTTNLKRRVHCSIELSHSQLYPLFTGCLSSPNRLLAEFAHSIPHLALSRWLVLSLARSPAGPLQTAC